MKEIIGKLIKEQQTPDGHSIYWMTNDSILNMGDESELRTIIWTTNEDGTNHELQNELEAKILENFLTYYREEKKYQLFFYTGQTIQYQSQYGDFARIQFTDHTLYLIEFNSGQY